MISVILIEPQFPGNIGAIARSMKNFNFENLILDKGHGGFRDPHLHGIAQIIAQNSNLL